MSNSGIYKITQIDTGRVYVGSSTNLTRRAKEHHLQLKGGYHLPNDRFREDHYKYGGHSFILEIIEEVPISQLNEREEYWHTQLKPYYNKYFHSRKSLSKERVASI